MSLFSEKEPPPSDPGPVNQEEINSYNEEAAQLFEQGKFEEAQNLWEKALGILEKPEGYLPDDQGKAEAYAEEALAVYGEKKLNNEQIEKLYDMAVSLFRGGKYVASKNLFERIVGVIPDYKAAQNYLTILDHKVKRAEQDLSEESFEKKVTVRREERAEWNRILEESRMELEKKMADQADPIYKDALGHYKSRDFALAKEYFAEVAKILPHYKDTDKYLSRIDKDIRDEEQRLVEEKRKQEALARKKEKEEWERILKESEEQLQKKLIEQVDPIYKEAVHYYKQREFELAKSRFEEAQLVVPNYKSTIRYLGRIDEDIRKEARLQQERRTLEMEKQKKEEELARALQMKREAQLREEKERKHLHQFKMEAAQRQKEREEWLKTLAESEEERRKKLEDQARFIYEEAVAYYKKRFFEQAKEDFLEVRRIYPDYKSTEEYLARLNKDIEQERQERLEERQRIFKMKFREKQLLEQKKWEEQQKLRAAEEEQRRKEYQEKSLAREKQRQEWQRILQENERERQKRLEEEADFVYQEALEYYGASRWQEAKADFIEVESILPGYKQTRKYLENIDQDIWGQEQERRQEEREALAKKRKSEMEAWQKEEERQARLQKEAEKRELERKQAQAEAVYKFAESLYKQDYYVQAKDKFLEVENILAGYKSTGRYLKRIDKDIAEEEERQRAAFEQQIREQRLAQKREQERIEELRAAQEQQKLLKLREEALLRDQERKEWEKTVAKIEQEHRKRLEEQTDLVYEEALRYYKAGWLQQAKETLEEVHAMWPGYKSTEKYLQKIGAQIQNEIAARRESEEEIFNRQQKQKELVRQQKNTRRRRLQKTEQEERIKQLEAEALARKKEKDRLKESMDRIEREHQKQIVQKAKALYRKAVKAYKAKDFENAKIAFIEVEKTSPGYRSTEKYLSRIDRDMKDERYARKVREEKEKDKLSRSAARSVEEALRERQEQFSSEAEAKYREAVALYKAKEFIQAKMKFIEVESLSPGYKRTLNYLGRIDKDISQNRSVPLQGSGGGRRNVIEQALSKVQGKSCGLSVPKGEGVFSPAPQKGEIKDWEKWIQARREELRRQRQKVQKEYERQFRQLYNRAVKLYRDMRYEEARSLFSQIEQMKPGYRGAASYLKKADVKIKKGLQEKEDHDVVFGSRGPKTRTDVINDVLNDLERK